MNQATWCNRQYKGRLAFRRLDRIYASEMTTWISRECRGFLMHEHAISDHVPLSLTFKCKILRRTSNGPPAFKFKNSFLQSKSFCASLKETWITATTRVVDPWQRWDQGCKAITELAKQEGRKRAKNRRREEGNCRHALAVAREACFVSMEDPFMSTVLKEVEEYAGRLEMQRAEAVRVQSKLHWLKVGDIPKKVFFRAFEM